MGEVVLTGPGGWVPHPEALPIVESREREYLVREMKTRIGTPEAVQRASERFRGAAALHPTMWDGWSDS